MVKTIAALTASFIWAFLDFMIGIKFSEKTIENGGINLSMVLVAYSAHIVGRFLGAGLMLLLCPELGR